MIVFTYFAFGTTAFVTVAVSMWLGAGIGYLVGRFARDGNA